MCDLSWLPPLLKLNDVGGDVHRYYDLLYKYYLEDLVFNPPEFEGYQVETISNPMKDGKENGFWHILEGGNEQYLNDSLDRHERIRWIKPLIESVGTDKTLSWKRPVKPSITKPHIALIDFSYIVVLRQHRFVQLVTAFPVERERRRDDLRKEYEMYQEHL